MAMYHLHVRFVQRSAGRSAVAAAAYRAGEKLYDQRNDETLDFRHKTHVEHSEILLPGHVPEALRDRQTLWNTVETSLSHPRAQPAFEVEVALPRELSQSQCVELVRSFAQEHFVDAGLIVDLNIHRPEASDGQDHPHAHMLITTRRWRDDGRMDKTARDLQDNPKLLQKIYALEKAGERDQALLLSKGTNLARWRAAWADYSNDYLERAGSEARIDHRTLEAQRIDRNPLPHIAHVFYDRTRDIGGRLARRVDAFRAAQFGRDMHRQFQRMERVRPDLMAEFVANAQSYAYEIMADLAQLDPALALEPDRDPGGDYER